MERGLFTEALAAKLTHTRTENAEEYFQIYSRFLHASAIFSCILQGFEFLISHQDA